MFDLKGKTALVTGSTQGIGFEIAKILSAHGAKVFVGGSENMEKCITASSKIPNSVPVKANLLKVDEIDSLYEQTGDVVFGAGGGVLFIPAHLVEEVVGGAAKTQVKDMFGFEMISLNKFTTAQIDKNTWSKEMLDLLLDWIEKDDRAIAYRGLDWSQEYDLAINGDPNDTQSAL